MSYPFVAAESWTRGGVPIRAIVIHMAEGGGTVSWLTRPDGNSSHYVVEYAGRVVQMVDEARAAGSINPDLVRTDNDRPFYFEGAPVTFGVTANREALGGDWRNPNAAVIAIEVEGFAKDGPNLKQRASLKALVADIRSRHGSLPTLGHRDFQNYKACPGRKVPWSDYGGHGIPQEDTLARFIKGVAGYVITIKEGTVFYGLDGQPSGVTASKDMTLEVVGSVDGSFDHGTVVEVSTGRLYNDKKARLTLLVVKQSNIAPAPPAPAPAPTPATYAVTVTVGGKDIPAGDVVLP